LVLSGAAGPHERRDATGLTSPVSDSDQSPETTKTSIWFGVLFLAVAVGIIAAAALYAFYS